MSNPLGRYDEKNREFITTLSNDEWTPRPWSNIITNKDFGTLVTSSGASFTWFLNSALFRLTPWVNDVVAENSGESIYLKDETTNETWSPTPLPIREKESYEIHHGLGYTSFAHTSHQILQKVKIFIHPNKPVKYVVVNLTNLAKIPRKISLSYYCQWVLGDFFENSNRLLWTGVTPKGDAVISKVLGGDFRSEYTAFLTCNDTKGTQLMTDRAVFFGHKPSNDPCGAIKREVTIVPGQEVSFTFALGVAKDDALDKELQNVKQGNVNKVFLDGQNFWQKVTKIVSVVTPDHDLNILFNDRLIYQALASRLWGRVGMYQPGGAFGFRDQLQDSIAMIWARPEVTREQILKAASRQLFSGEVQQWWHMPQNFGVTSSSSDSQLWLVYATNKYCQITGDDSILSEKIPYLNDSEEREATLYEHCLKAIERTLSMFGPHGLPLILSGDWNDSLDNIGPNRQGESVWLSLFLSYVLEGFSHICKTKKDIDKAENFLQIAKHQAALVEKLAWNSGQFVRAFADDGRVIGAPDDSYLQIDSIVQSWAVICGLVNKDLSKKAMESVLNKLIDREDKVVKLLTPPIPGDATPYLGYIQQYPQGVRENGGFYCHAAVWVVWALALQGNGDMAKEIIDMINPLKRTTTKEEVEKYMVEPYVLTSDIVGTGASVGQGGWSWYTGSAATLYVVLMEEVFGLKRRRNKLIIDPCLPKSWDKLSIKFQNLATTYQISIENPDKVSTGVKEIILDGMKVPSNEISLANDAITHQVTVILG